MLVMIYASTVGMVVVRGEDGRAEDSQGAANLYSFRMGEADTPLPLESRYLAILNSEFWWCIYLLYTIVFEYT